MSKKTKYLYYILIVICIAVVILSIDHYRNKKTNRKSETSVNCSNVKNDNRNREDSGEEMEKIKNELSEKFKLISEGDVYELTENNFQEGVEHQLDEEELEEIQKVFIEQNYQLNEKQEEIQKHYILNFYDKEENKVESIVIDNIGKKFVSNHMEIVSEELNQLLKELLAKNS